MHCSADLPDGSEFTEGVADSDAEWERATATDTATDSTPSSDASPAADGDSGGVLDPEGVVDDTLTVVVGIVGGLIIGVVGTVVLGVVTGSLWAVAFGIGVWLVATAHLVRRRTVQAVVARSGYGVGIVLLLIPVITLSPTLPVESAVSERFDFFAATAVIFGAPALVSFGIGWVASQFVPEN